VKKSKPNKKLYNSIGIALCVGSFFAFFIWLNEDWPIDKTYYFLLLTLSVFLAILCFRTAAGKKNFFSVDIDGAENPPHNISGEANFCPYCGAKTESDHLFCKKCGKNIE